jgi:hypothetical protein
MRRVFFTGFDRRPGAIVRAVDTSDVVRVVTLARETGAELAVRSGGHSRAGDGTSEGGIVLDLSAMNAVEIDSDGRAAWAHTGIKAGDYTSATGERGLATGLGDTATVGLGGITLGGGMGFLVRKHGLTIDAGEPAAGEKAIAPIRSLATLLADIVRPIRYPEMYAGRKPLVRRSPWARTCSSMSSRRAEPRRSSRTPRPRLPRYPLWKCAFSGARWRASPTGRRLLAIGERSSW